MLFKQMQENWQKFSNFIETLPNNPDEHVAGLIKRYIEQNVIILNEVLNLSIENLNKLQHAKTTNDIICAQAKFTHEISQKLSLSAQRFLNASLGHIADYNEWLKAHCDFATD